MSNLRSRLFPGGGMFIPNGCPAMNGTQGFKVIKYRLYNPSNPDSNTEFQNINNPNTPRPLPRKDQEELLELLFEKTSRTINFCPTDICRDCELNNPRICNGLRAINRRQQLYTLG